MEWQDYTVWAIGAAVALLVVRRLRRFACGGRRRHGCDACDAAGCPLRNMKDKKR